MSDEEQATGRTHVIIDRIIRELTDQPGMVVYRSDIAEKLGLEEVDVSSAIHRFKKNARSDVAREIQVVVPARSWRYTPNARVQRTLRVQQQQQQQQEVKTPPLTTSIRAYFENNPDRVVYLDELTDAMSTTDEPLEKRQVYVGINNAKISNPEFKARLETVVSGRAWRYDSEPTPVTPVATASMRSAAGLPTPPVTSVATPPVTAPVPPVTMPVPTPPVNSVDLDAEVLLFEKVTDLPDGSVLVRDENQNVFRLTRI